MKKHDVKRNGWSAHELGKQALYKDVTDMKQRLMQGDNEQQSGRTSDVIDKKESSREDGDRKDEAFGGVN